jgi:uncharacterized membrane protein YoaK (UPF0700 family)
MKKSTTLCLTAIAGFIDTVTFVLVGGLFAAHVTGNFVVFGASLAGAPSEHDYLKLIAFPVFVLAVMVGAAIFGSTREMKFRGAPLLLLLQGILFAGVALWDYFDSSLVTLYALILVAAMGLQNSLHRYVSGPMTTVMTGTVMNWSAAKAEKLFKLPVPEAKSPTNKPMTGWMIAAFAIGCALAGFATKEFGFTACVAPAFLLCVLSISEMRQKNREIL